MHCYVQTTALHHYRDLARAQYTVGFLNPMSFRFPNLILNLVSTVNPVPRMAKGLKRSEIRLEIWICMIDAMIINQIWTKFKNLQKTHSVVHTYIQISHAFFLFFETPAIPGAGWTMEWKEFWSNVLVCNTIFQSIFEVVILLLWNSVAI